MKIFKVLYYLFLALIGIVAVLLIVSVLPITRLFGGQAGNYKVMVVLSGSMQPTIKTGSIVAVKPEKDYKIGDIITFGAYGKNKTPTTHRIYDIKVNAGKPVYITKGDANNAPDQKEVQRRDVLGKVLFSVPYFGYAVEAARKPIGFMFLIIVPAAIIIGDEIRKIVEEVRKRKMKKIIEE